MIPADGTQARGSSTARTSPPGASYLFGHSDAETRRLRVQAQLFNPSTHRMLVDAGVAPGMRVLDVGSGAGDVALLVAELVEVLPGG